MGKEMLNLQRRILDWQFFTRQRKAQCSQETTDGQMQQRWVRRNGKMYVMPFHCDLH